MIVTEKNEKKIIRVCYISTRSSLTSTQNRFKNRVHSRRVGGSIERRYTLIIFSF